MKIVFWQKSKVIGLPFWPKLNNFDDFLFGPKINKLWKLKIFCQKSKVIGLFILAKIQNCSILAKM